MQPIISIRRSTILSACAILFFVTAFAWQFTAPETAFAAVNCGDSSWSVGTEADLNAAIVCFNAKPAGSYTITLTADIPIGASTTQINNATAGAQLIVEGSGFAVDGQNGDRRPFEVMSNTDVTLQNIIIKRGRRNGQGGGILNNGTLTLDRVLMQDNKGTRGGAIYSNGPLTITQSVIQGSEARYTGSGTGIGGAVEHNNLVGRLAAPDLDHSF